MSKCVLKDMEGLYIEEMNAAIKFLKAKLPPIGWKNEYDIGYWLIKWEWISECKM